MSGSGTTSSNYVSATASAGASTTASLGADSDSSFYRSRSSTRTGHSTNSTGSSREHTATNKSCFPSGTRFPKTRSSRAALPSRTESLCAPRTTESKRQPRRPDRLSHHRSALTGRQQGAETKDRPPAGGPFTAISFETVTTQRDAVAPQAVQHRTGDLGRYASGGACLSEIGRTGASPLGRSGTRRLGRTGASPLACALS